jgi:hypothetical protein
LLCWAHGMCVTIGSICVTLWGLSGGGGGGVLVSSDQHLGLYLADQRLVLLSTTASLLIFMIELVSLCTENFFISLTGVTAEEEPS